MRVFVCVCVCVYMLGHALTVCKVYVYSVVATGEGNWLAGNRTRDLAFESRTMFLHILF